MIHLARVPALVGDIAAEEPVTLARAKRHLRIDRVDADLDADLQALIATARAAAEDRTHRTLLSRQRWQLTLDTWPAVLTLPRAPILQVDQVTYRDTSGALVQLAPEAIQLQGTDLLPTWGTSWPAVATGQGAITIAYTAGYGSPATVPGPLCQWILLALGDLDLVRERSAERPSVPQEFADELLVPYKIWGGLA